MIAYKVDEMLSYDIILLFLIENKNTASRGADMKNTRINELDGKAIARGKEWMEDYLGIPLKQVDGMESVGTVKDTWEDRPRTNLVKWLMEKSGKSVEEIASAMGRSVAYLNNKIHRGTFSLDEVIFISYICGFAITMTSNDPDAKDLPSYQIDVYEYFHKYDEEALKRLYEYEKKMRDQKKEEYEKLKDQLEKMKEQFGFED